MAKKIAKKKAAKPGRPPKTKLAANAKETKTAEKKPEEPKPQEVDGPVGGQPGQRAGAGIQPSDAGHPGAPPVPALLWHVVERGLDDEDIAILPRNGHRLHPGPVSA